GMKASPEGSGLPKAVVSNALTMTGLDIQGVPVVVKAASIGDAASGSLSTEALDGWLLAVVVKDVDKAAISV
ncbi:hypothetical protein ACFPL7_12280, partial [Dongia soli]|uniref:hypothetical protein n=1 Tax=Dongia soli TaxID=600628 RepID=UPI00361AF308